jgi:hypothetical protein
VLSVQWLLEFQHNATTQAERDLKREFSQEREQLERLATPLEIGQQVRFRLVMGSRSISGRLNGLIGDDYVKVSNKRVLIQDIEESEREHVQWSFFKTAEDRELELQNRSDAINAEVDKRSRFLVRRAFEERGLLEPDIFATTYIQTGDSVCERSYLGEGKASLVLQRVTGSRFVTGTMSNAAQFNPIVMVGRKAISVVSTKTGAMRALSLDLGGDFTEQDLANVEIWCYQSEAGYWRLAVNPGFTPRDADSNGRHAIQAKLSFSIVEHDRPGAVQTVPLAKPLSEANYEAARVEAIAYQNEVVAMLQRIVKRASELRTARDLAPRTEKEQGLGEIVPIEIYPDDYTEREGEPVELNFGILQGLEE